MGRTAPTYRLLIDSLAQEWGPYRRALRTKDREAFDRLLDKVRAHSSACGYANRIDPMESAFMSILLEQEKALRAMADDLERLSAREGEGTA